MKKQCTLQKITITKRTRIYRGGMEYGQEWGKQNTLDDWKDVHTVGTGRHSGGEKAMVDLQGQEGNGERERGTNINKRCNDREDKESHESGTNKMQELQ